MIGEINRSEIPKCVGLIRESFMTVANELCFDETSAPRFTAFSTTEKRKKEWSQRPRRFSSMSK